MHTIDEKNLTEEAVALAAQWQERADQLLTSEEKGIQEQMMRLLTHPMDKVILTRLIDQSFRSDNASRVADQVDNLLRKFGVPDFFSYVEKLLVQMFLGVGRYIPSISVPKMMNRMRHDSSRAIIPGEPEILHAHLRKRKKQGVRMNINHLGEAVLGEEEAARHLESYLKDLENPEIEYISVKISTIYSQINPLAFEHTVSILMERLSKLYRTAGSNYFTRLNGEKVPKFVNLDMEEYRDLRITAAAFMRTLDKDEFLNHSAGIVLQAYLPDSYQMQREITKWAIRRVEKGGSPIKIRIVKGANMEMELLESALMGWPLAPYDNKLHVDANYKRMVAYGMEPENINAVRLGVASHNLFEFAWTYKLAEKRDVFRFFTFEMLEGMADHVRRAVCETSCEMVLYAPVAAKDQFINAIAYLIRRLDENTAKENFLRYAPGLKINSKEWKFLQEKFELSCRNIDDTPSVTHRTQDRTAETFPRLQKGSFYENCFINESDTDWCIPSNVAWAESIRKKWQKAGDEETIQIPLVVGGEEIWRERDIRETLDLSMLPKKIQVAGNAMGTIEDVEKAISTAREDSDGWRSTTLEERHRILSRVANELRRARGDLIGSAAAGTGKVFREADAEVSEAIDFCEFYPYSAETFDQLKGVENRGRGVGLVISPWNFPIAIPCGGMAAGLAAGNTIIAKPSSDAVLTAWYLCNCFWKAGVPKTALQFLPCTGSVVGKLAGHDDVDFIIFTGGTETGLGILSGRPGLLLAAETGGKNATIVTAMSDRDQAIGNVVHSAFGNCGQKCSATSLLILDKEVYDDEKFKKQLVDAARSFATGSAWDFSNKMGPLIKKPSGPLEKALTSLLPGESWALEPENIDANPNLWTPGIKWGVAPGSFTHMTEFFGPLLAVIKADNLEQAIEIVNQTGYGLTSGLESLDDREQEVWKEKTEAGNLYINRGTTGAVVLRQPFGGMKKSALGAGIKAGGPNYLSQFMEFNETGFPKTGAILKEHPMIFHLRELEQKIHIKQYPEFEDDIYKTIRAVTSYLYNMEQEFSLEKDYFHLRGQDNIIRYLPVGRVMVRLHKDDTLFDILGRILAARIAGCSVDISLPHGIRKKTVEFLKSNFGRKLSGNANILAQTEKEVAGQIGDYGRIRYGAPYRASNLVLKQAAVYGRYIARGRVMMEGRLELLNYFREQSLCVNYHRYGNLGERQLVE